MLDASEAGVKLYDWQRRWLDDESRLRIMLKSRAVGGSFLIALESFLLSLIHDNFLILLLRNLIERIERDFPDINRESVFSVTEESHREN